MLAQGKATAGAKGGGTAQMGAASQAQQQIVMEARNPVGATRLRSGMPSFTTRQFSSLKETPMMMENNFQPS
jgi:hypothetical protein